jgi:hypothetical protein
VALCRWVGVSAGAHMPGYNGILRNEEILGKRFAIYISIGVPDSITVGSNSGLVRTSPP